MWVMGRAERIVVVTMEMVAVTEKAVTEMVAV